jgi:hypothetical protein
MAMSGYINSRIGLRKGLGERLWANGLSALLKPMTGIKGRYIKEGMMFPFPTRARKVSGKNL